MESQDNEKQNLSEPHVQVFGEEVSKKGHGEKCCDGHGHHHGDHCCCRHYKHQGGGFFGLMILLGGVLLLLNNIGTVPWQVWDYIWPFWPAFLILIGVNLILGHSWPLRFVSFLISLAVFGSIIIYALIQIGSPLVNHIPSGIVNFVNQLKI